MRQLPKAISRVIKSHGATARALRHTISAETNEFARRRGESASTRAIPAEGSSAHRKNGGKQTSSFCTSTTPIPAERCAGTARIAKNLEFWYLDHADPRRGSRRQKHRKKNLEFLHRSPQRVHPRTAKTGGRKNLASFCTSRPRRSQQRVARAPQETKIILEFLYLDHADPRRGFIRAPPERKKPRVFAPRPRRSPHQKTSSFCTSTTPIPAEGRNPDLRSKSCLGALET